MNLAIDLGNSYTKLGVFNLGELQEVIVISNSKIDKVKDVIPDLAFKSTIISSVINTPRVLIDTVREITKQLIIFDKNTPLLLKNEYKSQETLGNDRLALANGAYLQNKGRDILIIDAGSCITYDFVKKSGSYTGGAISPGIDMRFRALNTFTDKLPLIERDKDAKITGRNTAESIRSGVINGVVFEINSAISHYKSKYPGIKIIITGGDAIFLAKKIKSRIFVEPNFLLISLNQILLHNE
jgi:type III pantothenate kinase